MVGRQDVVTSWDLSKRDLTDERITGEGDRSSRREALNNRYDASSESSRSSEEHSLIIECE